VNADDLYALFDGFQSKGQASDKTLV